MIQKIKNAYLDTFFIVSFENLINDEVFKNFQSLLCVLINNDNLEQNLKEYQKFIISFKKTNYDDLSSYFKYIILKNDKPKKDISIEISLLSKLCDIKFEDIRKILEDKFCVERDIFSNLAYFKNSKFKLSNEDFKNSLRTYIFNDKCILEPVETSENIKFSDLKGYTEQKKVLYDNTKALLQGAKVNNILLYGDAGCGKSSSVRALLNEFVNLKIVQIFKNNLINLDKLYQELEKKDDKFIIFADDISFDEADETFSTMKAVLEGSLIQCPKNAVIYATSNRRHLVKESFQGRKGDEIHLSDTINELGSLADRFGINLLFTKPTNDEFRDIVLSLAHDKKIELDDEIIFEKAKKLAILKGSNSPRIAKQLIDSLDAKVRI